MELGVLSKRVKNYDKALEELNHLEDIIDSLPQYQLSDPQWLMSAKAYKTKIAQPLVKKLKSLIKTVLVRCYEGWDNYHRLNTTNKNLYKNNERLVFHNKQLTADNNRLKEEVKDYKLLERYLDTDRLTAYWNRQGSRNSVVHALETKFMKGRDRQ